MTTDIELGALLRRLREARKEPLRVVAAAADIDSTLLSRIERGERLPTERQMTALAAHFGVPLEDLRPMRNAARMMRQWADPEEVLRAADVIERTSSSRRPRGARFSEAVSHPLEMPFDAMQAPAPATGPDLMQAEVQSVLRLPAGSRRQGRDERLQRLEAAAEEGARALDELERASRDRDSVIALRATELLRQLASKLG